MRGDDLSGDSTAIGRRDESSDRDRDVTALEGGTDSTSSNPNYQGENVRLARIESLLSRAQPDHEIDLRELLRIIWRRKWRMVAITAGFVIASAALAFWLPVEYTATAMLVPAENSNPSTLSKLAGEFGGLAALGGINLPQTGDRASVALQVMQSWEFLSDFVRQNHLEVPVFAATGWDRSDNRLYIDPDLYNVKRHKWVRRFSPAEGETAAPSNWELYKALMRHLTVDQDKKTNLITVSVEFYSPIMAKEWVDKLIAAINREFRLQDREEAEKSIHYLNDQLNETQYKELRTALYELLEDQMKTLMLTEVNKQYVLKTVSAAKVPDHKSSPRRLMICLTGLALGVVIALIFVVAGDAMQRGRRDGTKP